MLFLCCAIRSRKTFYFLLLTEVFCDSPLCHQRSTSAFILSFWCITSSFLTKYVIRLAKVICSWLDAYLHSVSPHSDLSLVMLIKGIYLRLRDSKSRR